MLVRESLFQRINASTSLIAVFIVHRVWSIVYLMNHLFATAFSLILQEASGGRMTVIKQGLTNPDLSKFLAIAALLFIIGVAGVLTRRNIIVIFMSIELMLNAANLNFVTFSRYLQATGNMNAVAGQVFTVFIIVVAAAEAAIGLGIVIALYRNKETILIDEIDLLKW
ncbi:MAG TPA: NADH-quinone oxidoreductase subunit NuoK [Pyrinomonadaceae bacterium]|jgi:NADH:ubiquinone oxidoreductase subunit K